MPASGLASAREAGIVAAPVVEPEKQPETAPATTEEKEQWVLWGVLVLGVLALLGIALWLARSMRKK